MKKIILLIMMMIICLPVIGQATDYYVTQDGIDEDCYGSPCSVATFNALTGDYSNNTFYFS